MSSIILIVYSRIYANYLTTGIGKRHDDPMIVFESLPLVFWGKSKFIYCCTPEAISLTALLRPVSLSVDLVCDCLYFIVFLAAFVPTTPTQYCERMLNICRTSSSLPNRFCIVFEVDCPAIQFYIHFCREKVIEWNNFRISIKGRYLYLVVLDIFGNIISILSNQIFFIRHEGNNLYQTSTE